MSEVTGRERLLTIRAALNEQTSVLVTVEDTGCGIEQAHLDRCLTTQPANAPASTTRKTTRPMMNGFSMSGAFAKRARVPDRFPAAGLDRGRRDDHANLQSRPNCVERVFKRWRPWFLVVVLHPSHKGSGEHLWGQETRDISSLTGNSFAGYAIAHGTHGARLVTDTRTSRPASYDRKPASDRGAHHPARQGSDA
jgi:hypothetical protein